MGANVVVALEEARRTASGRLAVAEREAHGTDVGAFRHEVQVVAIEKLLLGMGVESAEAGEFEGHSDRIGAETHGREIVRHRAAADSGGALLHGVVEDDEHGLSGRSHTLEGGS